MRQFGVQRLRRHRDVEIVRVIVDHNAPAESASPGVPCAATGNRKCYFCGDRKTHPAVTDSNDGGGMKRVTILRLVMTVMILFGAAGALRLTGSAAAAAPAASSAPAANDDGALFTAFVPVLRHPRCMNCHSQGDYPRQGDDGHPHTMDIRRGAAGFGVTAVKCSTCHQDHNLDGAHLPPGAPGWHLPPPDMPMIWQGLTDGEICESIKDPKQNRGRNIDQLVEHLTEDKLVMWGWNPGEGRTSVPIPHDEFSTMVKRWQAAGAPCPAS